MFEGCSKEALESAGALQGMANFILNPTHQTEIQHGEKDEGEEEDEDE